MSNSDTHPSTRGSTRPSGTQPPGTDPPGAGVWRRLAALVYDSFLLFALLFAATLVYSYASHTLQSAPADEVVRDLPVAARGWGYQLYLLAVIGGFYCYFWRRSGQTLGMQAWRLRLDSATGGRPDLGQCLRRILAGAPSLLLAGAGYWWVWIDREHLAWHDRFSATRVVVVPKSR